LSSPYCIDSQRIVVESSPYVFDKEFYTNNPNILNDNVDTDIVTYRATYNHHIKRLYEAHESIIDSAVLEEFTPIKMPNPLRPIRANLPDSCKVNDPISFFELFLRDKDFDLIVCNTNKYSKEYLTLYLRNSH